MTMISQELKEMDLGMPQIKKKLLDITNKFDQKIYKKLVQSSTFLKYLSYMLT